MAEGMKATGVKETDRREQILEGAGQLFATKGVSATTVREIGNAAGLLSGSLYHYFDSKEAMVEAIVASFLTDLSEAYARASAEDDDPRECLAAMIRASFQVMAQHPYACHIFQHDFNHLRTLPRFEALDGMARDSERAWLDVLAAGVARGQFRDDVDPLVFYRFNRDAIFLTVRWYREGGHYTLDELADSCISIFLQGYAVPPTR
jgi:TetR/AcrR family transcriptional regulator, cholesterol catabolism regulator